MPKPKTTRQPRLFLPEQLARIENGVDTEAYPLADTWAWVESIQDALRDDQQEWDKANGRGNYLKQSGIVEREVEFDRWGKPIRPLKAEKTKHSWAKLWEKYTDERIWNESGHPADDDEIVAKYLAKRNIDLRKCDAQETRALTEAARRESRRKTKSRLIEEIRAYALKLYGERPTRQVVRNRIRDAEKRLQVKPR